MGSIRARLTGGSAILLIGIAVAFSIHLVERVRVAAEDSFAVRVQTVATIAAASLGPAVRSDDAATIETILAALRAEPDLAYVVVLDYGDRVIASHEMLAGEAARFRTGVGEFPATGVWRAAVPLADGAGMLFVGFATDTVTALVAAERAKALWLAVLVVLAGTTGLFAIAGVLTDPLRAIVRTVDRVAGGDLTARTELRTRSEIGWLGRSFDTMIARLEEAYDALKLANRDLEGRVADRTRALRKEVDERRRAEDALRESERKFRSMFESAAVGIALIRPDGRFLATNASLADLLGYAAEDLAGTPLSTLIEPDDRPVWSGLEARLGSASEPAQEELRLRTADGHTRWARVVASGVDVEDGASFGIVMFDDITERKALEEQLRQSQKLEAVGRLAGGIAHDFNNLLTTINGLAAMLIADSDVRHPHRADLEEIRKAGEHAAALTGQLLAFSRRQIVLPEIIDVNAAIRDMDAMLARMAGPGIRLELDLSAGLHAIRADPGQFAQVLMNLVVNARDAMPAGGAIRIRTRNDIAAGDSAVMLTVADSGSGMNEDTRQRIFEPFFTTKEHGKGTGLGLSTVYGIVQQAGGEIKVESDEGVGSVFHIRLPSLGLSASPATGTPAKSAPLGSETVLVVEDEDSVRRLVGRILRQTGYTVLEGEDGDAALAIFNSHAGRIDAVVTDVVMPRMSGPELARMLVRQQPGLPVLFMSGYTRDEALATDFDQKGTGFIQKPMTPSTLTRKLREVLDSAA